MLLSLDCEEHLRRQHEELHEILSAHQAVGHRFEQAEERKRKNSWLQPYSFQTATLSFRQQEASETGGKAEGRAGADAGNIWEHP